MDQNGLHIMHRSIKDGAKIWIYIWNDVDVDCVCVFVGGLSCLILSRGARNRW